MGKVYQMDGFVQFMDSLVQFMEGFVQFCARQLTAAAAKGEHGYKQVSFFSANNSACCLFQAGLSPRKAGLHPGNRVRRG
jgi:hypothetical protein